jgi:hypothetical protein
MIIDKICPFCGHKPCSIEMIFHPEDENIRLIFCSLYCVEAYVKLKIDNATKNMPEHK